MKADLKLLKQWQEGTLSHIKIVRLAKKYNLNPYYFFYPNIENTEAIIKKIKG